MSRIEGKLEHMLGEQLDGFSPGRSYFQSSSSWQDPPTSSGTLSSLNPALSLSKLVGTYTVESGVWQPIDYNNNLIYRTTYHNITTHFLNRTTPWILVPSPDAMADVHNDVIMQVGHFCET